MIADVLRPWRGADRAALAALLGRFVEDLSGFGGAGQVDTAVFGRKAGGSESA